MNASIWYFCPPTTDAPTAPRVSGSAGVSPTGSWVITARPDAGAGTVKVKQPWLVASSWARGCAFGLLKKLNGSYTPIRSGRALPSLGRCFEVARSTTPPVMHTLPAGSGEGHTPQKD